MRTGKWAVPLLILTCAIASTGSTQERRLKHSDLPPAVQKTADQESHGATVRGYSSEQNGEQLEYEVAMRLHGHNRDVTSGAALTKRGALVAYEAHVRTGTKRSEIQVGPDGKPLAHPE